ncbi:hypothetical protein SPRG_14224 [Saprolegnia parasitica CBS 223.65]|uniref:Helicase-associated domain-containing protein n=1 Tax=Saprolegnia parasitica (strain CBS 223.65) TaxID=695850 RepID=A0A067C0I8_SAPPC|nr:hypothetical protein SPRG_14224 [Saprolegnia parasitica CBS 223.65]KDO20076.1 hypothetical protein SPRG_14224 [Saprolegnia parasitica CBS 223.65]|eukprot:XP_012209236.1 hypothetical protein SPRG_14224 [Saprolegnia parasitica CBS 223.65]
MLSLSGLASVDIAVDPATLPKIAERLLGLAIYRRLHGHSYVPRDYVVPDAEPWPMTLRSKPLGAAVTILRAASCQLDPAVETRLEGLGFVWCHVDARPAPGASWARSRSRIMVSWSVVLSALARYRELYGHVYVPANWPVPEHDDSWPRAAWGIDLAQAAHTLDLRTALALGAVYDVPLWADVLAMLTRYCEHYGAANVPIEYVIKSARRKRKADASLPSWSANYDGIPLGEVAMRVWLVCIQLPTHRQEELERVRFTFNTSTSWANVMAAKAVFASLYGHDLVPLSYVVPMADDDVAWPVAMRGLRLGHYLGLQTMTHGEIHRVAAKLSDPFADASDQETAFDRHVLSLRIYKRCCKNNTLVDRGFVVPHSENGWPRKLWGLRLGAVVASLRHDGALLSAFQRATLNDIGFIWDPDVAAAWPAIGQGFEQWKATMGWPDAFVLTSSSQWPKSVVGQTLGYLLTLLEVHDDFASKTQRETLRRFSLDIERRWSTKVHALTAYYARHGHLRVLQNHVEPTEIDDAFWPGGMPLGSVVSWLRQVPRAVLPYDKRRQLEALSFEWELVSSDDAPDVTSPPLVAESDVIVIDGTVSVNWAMWAVALTQFKAHEGHANIPSDYVVGVDDARWPVALRSFPVGPILADVRSDVVVPPTWVQRQVEIVGVDLSRGTEARTPTRRSVQ